MFIVPFCNVQVLNIFKKYGAPCWSTTVHANCATLNTLKRFFYHCKQKSAAF